MVARLEVKDEDCGFVCVAELRDDEDDVVVVGVVLAADEDDGAFEERIVVDV